MTDIKTKEFIKELEKNGFSLVRASKHLIYKKAHITLAVPHKKFIKRNTHRQLRKLMEEAA